MPSLTKTYGMHDSDVTATRGLEGFWIQNGHPEMMERMFVSYDDISDMIEMFKDIQPPPLEEDVAWRSE